MKNLFIFLAVLVSAMCAQAQNPYSHLTDAQRDSMTAPIIKNSKYIFEAKIIENTNVWGEIDKNYIWQEFNITEIHKGNKDLKLGKIKMIMKNQGNDSHHYCYWIFTGVSYIFFVNEVPQAKLKELNIKPDTTYPNQKIVQFTNPCFQPFGEVTMKKMVDFEWIGGFTQTFKNKEELINKISKFTKFDSVKKKEKAAPKNQNKLSSSVMSINPLPTA